MFAGFGYLGAGDGTEGKVEPGDVLTIPTGTAPRAMLPAELKAKLAAAGGVLNVAPYSSELIIAANEHWQFNVTANPDGTYRITAKTLASYAPYILGAGAAIFLLTTLRKS